MPDNLSTRSQPLVSIVIPTFNRARLLPRAVEACLKQTYENIEIIVVNDGSSDDTERVCEALASADRRVRVFHKPNEGIGHTLNYGFARTEGDYVTWSSDDNYFHSDAIERLLRFMQENPDVGFAYSDAREIDAENNVLGIYKAPEHGTFTEYCIVRGCLLYKREVMQKVGPYDNRWTRCQDFDYYLRVNKQFKIGYLPEVLYDYTVHEASMSGDHEAHILEEAELLAFHAASASQRRMIWANRLTYLGHHFENRNQLWKAAKLYSMAVPYSLGRIADVRRTAFRALYTVLPSGVRGSWRAVKRRVALPNGRKGE